MWSRMMVSSTYGWGIVILVKILIFCCHLHGTYTEQYDGNVLLYREVVISSDAFRLCCLISWLRKESQKLRSFLNSFVRPMWSRMMVVLRSAWGIVILSQMAMAVGEVRGFLEYGRMWRRLRNKRTFVVPIKATFRTGRWLRIAEASSLVRGNGEWRLPWEGVRESKVATIEVVISAILFTYYAEQADGNVTHCRGTVIFSEGNGDRWRSGKFGAHESAAPLYFVSALPGYARVSILTYIYASELVTCLLHCWR
jgi:hypothetical protein